MSSKILYQNLISSQGLFGDVHMPYEVDRDTSDDGTPSLKEMVEMALRRLRRSDDGFFLLVGGKLYVIHRCWEKSWMKRKTHQNSNLIMYHLTSQIDCCKGRFRNV